MAEKKVEYPWQLGDTGRGMQGWRIEAERRASLARFLFKRELRGREEGSGADPELFQDGRRGFFHFSEGTFALSREHANWPALKEKGFFREYGM